MIDPTLQPARRSRSFSYADCRTLGGDCDGIQYEIRDVCTIPPPGRRGPLPTSLTGTRIRGAPAFRSSFAWEVYTGRVVIRVHGGGRDGRRAIIALRGLNAPAEGLRPGRPFPPPIPGALERRLPCPRAG